MPLVKGESRLFYGNKIKHDLVEFCVFLFQDAL